MAEGRIIGNRNVVCAEASRPDGETQVSERNLAPESSCKLRFNLGSKGVRVDHEWQDQHHNYEDADDDCCDFQGALHGRPPLPCCWITLFARSGWRTPTSLTKKTAASC